MHIVLVGKTPARGLLASIRRGAAVRERVLSPRRASDDVMLEIRRAGKGPLYHRKAREKKHARRVSRSERNNWGSSSMARHVLATQVPSV